MNSFKDVQFGPRKSACSPDFSLREPFGLKINAPEFIRLSERDQNGDPQPFPLCLAIFADGLFMSRFDIWRRFVKVVLVDELNREVITTGIWHDRMYRPKPPSTMPPQELQQQTVTSWWTANLREFVDFPLRTTTYKVHAVLDKFQSNVVTVEVQAE